jgi:hypothetical protein
VTTPVPSGDDQQPSSTPSPGSAGGTGTTSAAKTAPPAPVATRALGKIGKDTVAALQAALAAEHAALWSYGLVAAHDTADGSTIGDMMAAHQVVRDSTADLVVRGGGTPVGPAPAYSTPNPVTDTASGRALALILEEDCAAAWRAVIGTTDDPVLRGLALNTLTDTAGRMVTWNTLLAAKKITTAFPGQLDSV